MSSPGGRHPAGRSGAWTAEDRRGLVGLDHVLPPGLETSLRGGAAVVLRSKSPPMIRQEIYAILCCYQAIRTLISHAAGDADLTPPGSPSPGPVTESAAASATPAAFPPDQLNDLAADPTFEITYSRNLVPNRPGRRYKRETKQRGGRYKTRQPGQPSRLTPLTVIRFWQSPSHLNLMPLPACGGAGDGRSCWASRSWCLKSARSRPRRRRGSPGVLGPAQVTSTGTVARRAWGGVVGAARVAVHLGVRGSGGGGLRNMGPKWFDG